jgi:hypothetical protein
MPELVDASSTLEPKRCEVKEAILIVSIEGLTMAFEHLKKIRAVVGQAIPILNRKQLYEDFSAALSVAYKRFAQEAAKLLCPDTGFIFHRKPSSFRSGCTRIQVQLAFSARLVRAIPGGAARRLAERPGQTSAISWSTASPTPTTVVARARSARKHFLMPPGERSRTF